MKRILLFTMMCLFGLFSSLNAQDLDGKSYRIKVNYNVDNDYASGQYLTNVEDALTFLSLDESNLGQQFTFEATGNADEYYMKSATGYYVYCSTYATDPVAANTTNKSGITVKANGTSYTFASNGNQFTVTKFVYGGAMVIYCNGGTTPTVLWDLEEVATGEGGDDDTPTEETIAFFYDFNDGSLEDWNIFYGNDFAGTPTSQDKGTNWGIESGVGAAEDGENTDAIGSNSFPSGAVYCSNYIVTKNAYQITESSKLSWYVTHTEIMNYASNDPYKVVVSETGAADSFVEIYSGTATVGDYNKEVSFPSEYVGKALYIGFYHYGWNGDVLVIDNIKLTNATLVEGGGDEPGNVTENVVVVGEGSTEVQAFLPLQTNYDNTISEQIFLADDFKSNTGKIISYAFKSAKDIFSYGTPVTVTRNFKVYMINTAKASFNGVNDWVNMTNSDLVFNGSVTVQPKDTWTTITFDTPFEYEAGKNVILCIHAEGSWNASSGNYYKHTTDNVRSLCFYADGQVFDATNITVASIFDNLNYVAQSQFTFESTGSTPEPEPEPTPTAPEAPVVTAEATASTTATLAWAPVDGATSYNVYMLYDGGEYLHGTVTDTTYSVSYLVAGANNCFDVTAVNEIGESERTNVCVLTYPAAPKNLATTAVTETSISLTWDAVTSATYYYVYKDGVQWASTSGATTYTEYGLTPGTTYCFNVSAENASGESLLSEQLCETTSAPQIPIPGVPQNLEAEATSETTITLTWDAVDGAAQYGIYMKYNSEDYNRLGAVTTNRHEESHFSAGESACFKVSAENGSGASALTDEVCATTLTPEPEPLPVPQGLMAFTSEGQTITLMWNTVEGDVDGYKIYKDGELLTTVNSKYEMFYEVGGLEPGTQYCFTITSYKGDDESEHSVNVCATIPEPVVLLPYRLQSVTGENTGNNPDVYYVYSDDESRVESITEGSYATLVEYNEDGTVAKTTYVFMWNGAPDYTSNYTTIGYTYTDGVMTSYTETEYTPYNGNSTASEYTLAYNEDGTVAQVTVDNRTYAYEYEDGKLVKETYSYYDQYAFMDFTDYIREFEYDENGNCVSETKYNAWNNPPTPQSGVDYFYDLNVDADSVYAFACPNEILPARANLVAKSVSYSYNQDYETGETTKGDFSVKVYNYNEAVESAPLAPADLTAEVLSDTKVELTWAVVEEVESFNVYCNGTFLANITESSYTVEGLEPATEYTFAVEGVNGELKSAAAEVKATTMDLVNIVPNEVAFGNVKVGGYYSENTSTSVEIHRLGKTVKEIKSDNSFFRVKNTDLTVDPILLGVSYTANAETGEYEGNLLVILETGDTVTAPMTATAYTPVAPDVFELAKEVETVDGLFSDMPDFSTLTDDYNLPGEEEGNNPDAVYTFTLEEEATVEINVEGSGWTEPIYAVYKEFADGEGPKVGNAIKGKATGFSYDFEDGSLEDFVIVDTTDGYPEYTWKIEDGYLISWDYITENWTPILDWAEESIITKEAYNITEKSVLKFDARTLDENGYGAYEFIYVKVAKAGEEEFTEVAYLPLVYLEEWETQRVELGALFAEQGLEYGEYRISIYHQNGYCGSVAIDNLELTEAGAAIYPAGKYYIVAAGSTDFKVTVKSTALPELELNKDALYRLVSTESDLMLTKYNYASEKGTKVVNVKEVSNDLVDFLRYSDEGQLLGFVSCYIDEETGGIYDTVSELEYIYEDSVLVGYKELAVGWNGQVQEMEYVFHYNADGRIDTVRCEDMVTVYTYNEEGQLVEKADGSEYDGEVSFEAKEIYTYADSNLVKVETMYYDFYAAEEDTLQLPLDSFFSLAEEKVYEYDSLGNVISAKSYECNYDEENDTLIKNLWYGADYVYDYSIAYENVFYFEYPHYAYSSMSSPVQPSHANIILAEDSYYCYFDGELGEYVYHTQSRKTYRYEEYELEAEDAPAAPATPQNFVAKAINDSTIVLTWDAVEGATGYNVYQGTETLKEGVTETTYTVTGLAAATTYSFEVAAVNGELVSNRATATATTPAKQDEEPIVPDPTPVTIAAPDTLIAEALSTSSIKLTWSAVENATSYNVYVGDSITNVTDTTYTVENLAYDSLYCFAVTALNDTVESEKIEECAKTLGEGLAELSATVNIYPNPVSDRLVIETESYVESVSIYTVTGTLIYSEVDFNTNTVDVSEFRGGVYIMKVRTENGEVVKRFIKK